MKTTNSIVSVILSESNTTINPAKAAASERHHALFFVSMIVPMVVILGFVGFNASAYAQSEDGSPYISSQPPFVNTTPGSVMGDNIANSMPVPSGGDADTWRSVASKAIEYAVDGVEDANPLGAALAASGSSTIGYPNNPGFDEWQPNQQSTNQLVNSYLQAQQGAQAAQYQFEQDMQQMRQSNLQNYGVPMKPPPSGPSISAGHGSYSGCGGYACAAK